MMGPFFVSIGTPDKLRKFLKLNPAVPRDSILVDDYDHGLYRRLGFTRFDEAGPGGEGGGDGSGIDVGKLLRFVDLGSGGLWNYATRFLEMVPTSGRVDWMDLPEGGLRNGGTLVVRGDNIVCQWSDRIPGDVPDVANVMRIAREAANA